MNAAPFFKWVGGKRALLPSILPILRSVMVQETVYHEPFLGGGAVFFALRNHGLAQSASLSDANGELVQTYKGVQFDLRYVLQHLREHAKKSSEQHYAAVRKQHHEVDAEMAALFIYRAKTGFNGLYRVSEKSGFNVPWGKYKNPTICDEPVLRAASEALCTALIRQQDFQTSISKVKGGEVVYLDPPYVPTSATANFTAYTTGGFGPSEQELLAEQLVALDRRKALFVLSNADTPETRRLYARWRLVETERSGRVSCKGTGRGKVGELLVTNIPPHGQPIAGPTPSVKP